jgi:hypothetical protein
MDALVGTVGGHLAAVFTIAALVLAMTTDGSSLRRHDPHNHEEMP